jgi:hypothetical protein
MEKAGHCPAFPKFRMKPNQKASNCSVGKLVVVPVRLTGSMEISVDCAEVGIFDQAEKTNAAAQATMSKIRMELSLISLIY